MKRLSLTSVSVATRSAAGVEEQAERRRQDGYRNRRPQQVSQGDEFDSEDDGDFIVDDLGTQGSQGRQQPERCVGVGVPQESPWQTWIRSVFRSCVGRQIGREKSHVMSVEG